LIPFSIYERQTAFCDNPNLELLAPKYGGHLGFLSKRAPRFWLDQTVIEWAERIVGQFKPELRGTNGGMITSVHQG
jgi:predicted alpha/beta-fold hydrolase